MGSGTRVRSGKNSRRILPGWLQGDRRRWSYPLRWTQPRPRPPPTTAETSTTTRKGENRPAGSLIPANKKKGEKKLMRTCAACGKFVAGGIVMGGTRICRTCDVKVREEIDRLHAEGKPVNV